MINENITKTHVAQTNSNSVLSRYETEKVGYRREMISKLFYDGTNHPFSCNERHLLIFDGPISNSLYFSYLLHNNATLMS